MKQPRYLIINGDDFGLSSEVNQAILDCHRLGILSSASLMVTGDACQEAVEIAKAYPSLGVGLHLVLVCGQGSLPPLTIPHLVNDEGQFPDDPVKAGLNYQFNASARRELKEEVRSQLELFLATGLPLSHVDGHLHLHLHPVILQILVELAPEYGIKYLRLPLEELKLNLQLNPHSLLSKITTAWVFAQLRRYGEKLLNSHAISYPERVYGLLETGKITEEYLLQLIPQIKSNLVEIYTHPDQRGPGMLEKQALLSSQVKECLHDQGFIITNYLNLA